MGLAGSRKREELGGKWEVMKLEMQAGIISQRILWLEYLDFILSV